MKTKLIEQYLQFAIDNWYNANDIFKKLKIIENIKFTYEKADDNLEEIYSECYWLYVLDFIADVWTWYKNIIELITSKEFIEAIVRWIEKTMQADYIVIWWDKIFYDSMNKEVWFKKLVDYITIKQALAIRDNELALFIKEILWIEK